MVEVTINDEPTIGVWRCEPLDGFVPGATVFDKGVNTAVHKTAKLTEDDDAPEEVAAVWNAACAKVASMTVAKPNGAGHVYRNPLLLLTVTTFCIAHSTGQ